jgi:predicted tellurium resistance membrane protein TerC
MEAFFTLDNLVTLALLVLLQAVLGFDNLRYISQESKCVTVNEQKILRRYGLYIAVFLRIVFLFVFVKMIATFQSVLFSIVFPDVISVSFTLHSLIFLLGGIMIIYTATKKISHMLIRGKRGQRKPLSFFRALLLIILMNLVFSFEAVVSMRALTDSLFMMLPAMLVGVALMVWLMGSISTFVKQYHRYEMLGLLILFLVGIMLVSEGGDLANLQLFGEAIEPMSKVAFYLVVVLMIVVDSVQGQYSKKRQEGKKRGGIKKKTFS